MATSHHNITIIDNATTSYYICQKGKEGLSGESHLSHVSESYIFQLFCAAQIKHVMKTLPLSE